MADHADQAGPDQHGEITAALTVGCKPLVQGNGAEVATPRGGLSDLMPDQPLRARIADGRKWPLAVEVEPS